MKATLNGIAPFFVTISDVGCLLLAVGLALDKVRLQPAAMFEGIDTAEQPPILKNANSEILRTENLYKESKLSPTELEIPLKGILNFYFNSVTVLILWAGFFSSV